MPEQKKIACRVSNEVLDAFNNAAEKRKFTHQAAALYAVKQFIAGAGLAIAEPRKDDLPPSERAWVDKLLALLRSTDQPRKTIVQFALDEHAREIRASRKRAGE